MRRITIEVDELDARAIEIVVMKYQTRQRVAGELMLPEGEGDLRGRILAEICRGWDEMVEWRPKGAQ